MITRQRGNQAEAAVLAGLVDLDLIVSVPFGDGQPYDLLVDVGTAILRVQCKCSREDGGCVVFKSCSTDHGLGPRDYRGLADVFGVYFPPTRAVFIVPVQDVPRRVTALRLAPARNNQRAGVRMAADFAIERWSAEALAAVVGQPVRSGTSSPSATVSRP